MIRKRYFVSMVFVLMVWSVIIEPRWVVHRSFDVTFKHHQTLGLKVIVTADWHFTKQPLWRVMTHARAQTIIADINKAHPDIIVIAGDLIAEPRQKPVFASTVEEEIAQTLAHLKASKGVYAVLGNHDNWYNHARMKQALEQQHIQVLENAASYNNAAQLWIAGVGDAMTGHAKPANTVSQIPIHAPTLLMMHDPVSFTELPTLNSISVAGHTHGGQIYMPWLGAIVSPSRAPRSWAYGWVKHHHNWMYVTSGLGVSILPVRFNMRPEWVELHI